MARFRFTCKCWIFALLLVPEGMMHAQALQQNAFAERPLLFIENKGQVVDAAQQPHPEILFSTQNGPTKIYISGNALYFITVKSSESKSASKNQPVTIPDAHAKFQPPPEQQYIGHRLDLSLVGANPHPVVQEDLQDPYYENYYLPQCPQGIQKAASFKSVTLQDVYPGIDWVIYSKGQQLEYDFVVHAGAHPEEIQMQVSGSSQLQVSSTGDLVFHTPLGDITQTAPQSFNNRKQIASKIILDASGNIHFAIGDYDRTSDLRIDPSIDWSTYLGGGISDVSYAAAPSANGNFYVTGYSNSPNFPTTTGVFQPTFNSNYDAILLRITNSGKILWTSFFGGTGNDYSFDCTLDKAGNIYFTGTEASGTSFPTTPSSPVSIQHSGSDIFLVKCDSNGFPKWTVSTGGDSDDEGFGCSLDDSGNIFVCGRTNSKSWTMLGNSFQTTLNSAAPNSSNQSYDGFLMKYDPMGKMVWNTYFGGQGGDMAYSCSSDHQGNVYMAGYSDGANFPILSADQDSATGPGMGFLSKFDGNGNLSWSTYVGGSGKQYIYSIQSTADSNIIVTGTTTSNDLRKTSGAWQTTNKGGEDIFLAKYTSAGSLNWMSYFGGTADEIGYHCSRDVQGNINITGLTYSYDFPVSNDAFQKKYGTNGDAYSLRFDNDGKLIWSSYLGGSGFDYALSCFGDANGNMYIIGTTNSTNFPKTPGAAQSVLYGSTDFFLTRISPVFVGVSSSPETSYHLSCYPNPASQIVVIKGLQLGDQLILCNALGQKIRIIHAQPFGMTTLNLSDLPKGLYVVQAIHENGSLETQKLIIQ